MDGLSNANMSTNSPTDGTPSHAHGGSPAMPTINNCHAALDSLSDSDSDSDHDTRRQGALPVARFPIGDSTLPPISGEEYLRRVRAEANSLPTIIASTSSPQSATHQIDLGDTDDPRPTKRRRTATSSTEPASLSFLFQTTSTLVDRTWAQSILRDFDHLQERLAARRQSLIPVGPAGIPMSANVQQAARDLLPLEVKEQMPANESDDAWKSFLYPSVVASEKPTQEDDDSTFGDALGRDAICRPIFLLSLTQRKLLKLIRYHTAWIDVSVPRPALIDMAQVAYALLVGVDGDVLGMDGAGDVRELGKQCASVMSHFQQELDQQAQELDEEGEEGAVGDDEQEREWKEGRELCLAMRIVLVVVSQKFGQRDLCELVD